MFVPRRVQHSGKVSKLTKKIFLHPELQVLLVVPQHQRMDLGGLGDQDHGSSESCSRKHGGFLSTL